MNHDAHRLSLLGAASFCLLLGGCLGDANIEVSGQVFDPSWSPVAGATVTLEPAPGSTVSPLQVHTTETGSTGEFFNSVTYSPLAKGGFRLRVEKDGFDPYKINVSQNTYNLIISLSAKENGERNAAGAHSRGVP